jgi:hypothetical protein
LHFRRAFAFAYFVFSGWLSVLCRRFSPISIFSSVMAVSFRRQIFMPLSSFAFRFLSLEPLPLSSAALMRQMPMTPRRMAAIFIIDARLS